MAGVRELIESSEMELIVLIESCRINSSHLLFVSRKAGVDVKYKNGGLSEWITYKFNRLKQ